jgi:hypothetical protein
MPPLNSAGKKIKKASSPFNTNCSLERQNAAIAITSTPKIVPTTVIKMVTEYASISILGFVNKNLYASEENSGINREKPSHESTESSVRDALRMIINGTMNDMEQAIRKICTPGGVFSCLAIELFTDAPIPNPPVLTGF